MSTNPDDIADFIGFLSALYTIGIILWFLPYTFLVIILLIWSVRKPPERIARAFVFSPLMMAVLITGETALFYTLQSDGLSIDAIFSMLSLVALSIVFGYFNMGIVAGIYVLLRKWNFIQLEDDTMLIHSEIK
jgi:hypothetical protein